MSFIYFNYFKFICEETQSILQYVDGHIDIEVGMWLAFRDGGVTTSV